MALHACNCNGEWVEIASPRGQQGGRKGAGCPPVPAGCPGPPPPAPFQVSSPVTDATCSAGMGGAAGGVAVAELVGGAAAASAMSVEAVDTYTHARTQCWPTKAQLRARMVQEAPYTPRSQQVDL